jgi:hypothetical protein
MTHFINNCFQEKSLKIIQTIFENNDQDSLIQEEVTYEFKRLWNLHVSPTVKFIVSKKKKRCSRKINVSSFHFNKKEKNSDKNISIDIPIEEALFSDFQKLNI